MKPSSINLFLTGLAAIPMAITFAQGQTTNPPVYHGHLKVDQIDAGNNGIETGTPSVATQIVRKAGPGTATTADRGDFGINFGNNNTFANGIVISSVRQNGRNNGDKGDPSLTVQSTSSAWPTQNGDAILSGHSIANLAGTLYSAYDGGTGPSFDGGVAGSTFVHTGRPVAGFRPALPPEITSPLGVPHTANVTALVKDWAAGIDNNGLAIQPQRVGSGNAHTTDGWLMCTSSHANITYRPKISVEYIAPGSGAQVYEFQNGLSGYTSTVNSLVHAPLPGKVAEEKTLDGSTIETEWIDADGGTGAVYNQQGLFRFDNILGTGKITPGSKVARAYLVMTTNSAGNSQTNGPAVVRQMLKPWTPATLNSGFSANGITEADGVVGPAVDSVGAIGAYGEAWFDVTTAVQSWANGGANNGLHVTCTADGWTVFFTGAPLAAVRPRLVVVTTPAGQDVVPTIATFQNGVSGYTGTVDRAVSSTASENRDGALVNQYYTDGWNGTDSPQQAGLIRFDGLVGSTPNAIPAGSAILRANLTIATGSTTNAPSGGSFGVARLLEPFETQSGNTYSSEWNVDLAYAYFPFSEGWIGGLATNQQLLPNGTLVDYQVDAQGNPILDAGGNQISVNNKELVTLLGSPGLLIGDEESFDAHFLDYSKTVTPTGNGYYQLFLEGVNPTTDGILLVGGGKNEANYALSKPVSSEFGSAWEIVSHDNRANGSGGENDPVAFVYVPLTAVADGKAKALGRVMGDGRIDLQAGNFTVSNIAVGQFLLKIDGGSDAKGTLIVSPEGRGQRVTLDEFGNEVVQVLANVDNVVNYEWNATLDGWVVESRDLPGASLQTVDAVEGFFNFAYFEYPELPQDNAYQAWATENGLDSTNSDQFADPDGDGLKNFAEFALGTHPKKDDSSSATQVAMTGENTAKQLAITYIRRTDAGAKYNYIVEYSEDMKSWATSATAVETVATSAVPLQQVVTVKDAVAAGVKSRFVRVRLVYTP